MRCIAGAGDPGQLHQALKDLSDIAQAWFGSRLVRRYSLARDDAFYVTEMLEWSDGQGALLTVTSIDSGLDLILVGSRGTLYHEE